MKSDWKIIGEYGNTPVSKAVAIWSVWRESKFIIIIISPSNGWRLSIWDIEVGRRTKLEIKP